MSTSVSPDSKDAGEVWPWHRGISWVFSIATTLVHPQGVLCPPSHHPLGSGTKYSLLLPRCTMEQHVYPHHIHPGQHPPSSSLSTTVSAPSPGHRYLHSCSSPSPWLCSASVIPGRGGPGLCSTAAVPRSQETASINHRHIHPSPDPGMAIPGWA